jgi:hypothetical protein
MKVCLGYCRIFNDDVNRMDKLATGLRFTQLFFDLDSDFLKTNLISDYLALRRSIFAAEAQKKSALRRALF